MLYVPGLVAQFSMFSCMYPLNDPSYLVADSTTLCWEGEHLFYAALSAFMIFFLFVVWTNDRIR